MGEEKAIDLIQKEINEFFKEFLVDSDRAAVLVAAAAFDNILSDMVQQCLRPSVSRDDELLEGDSPLGSFSTKISMCHRLGLYSDRMCRALHMVRKIRNIFAHDIAGCSLDDGSLRDRVASLDRLIREKGGMAEYEKHFVDLPQFPPGSKKFRACIMFLYVKLLVGRQFIERVKSSATDWIPLTNEEVALRSS